MFSYRNRAVCGRPGLFENRPADRSRDERLPRMPAEPARPDYIPDFRRRSDRCKPGNDGPTSKTLPLSIPAGLKRAPAEGENGEHGRNKPGALQIPLHELDAALHQVMARRTHSVIPVGIDVELEGLVVLDESGNHLVRILNMHIVVARTVRDQQLALQAVGKMNRRVVVVSRRVILRQAVVDLGVNRIVEPP